MYHYKIFDMNNEQLIDSIDHFCSPVDTVRQAYDKGKGHLPPTAEVIIIVYPYDNRPITLKTATNSLSELGGFYLKEWLEDTTKETTYRMKSTILGVFRRCEFNQHTVNELHKVLTYLAELKKPSFGETQ